MTIGIYETGIRAARDWLLQLGDLPGKDEVGDILPATRAGPSHERSAEGKTLFIAAVLTRFANQPLAFWIGSTTEHVLDKLPCDVLAVK